MKFLITILAVLIIQTVDAVEERGAVHIIIEQHVGQPDVDECLERIDECADDEICVNLPGTYRCVCADGFEKVEGICIDIDECIEKCGMQGECANSPGSFTCTCNEGYEEVEGICEDIDECNDNANNLCGVNETCNNLPGNYICSCIQGYSKVFDSCEECLDFYLEDLGCISPETSGMKAWAEFNATCQSMGKRLIEGIKEEHLDTIRNAFKDKLNDLNPWTGMKESRWVISQIDVDSNDEVWANNEPSLESNNCGLLSMDDDDTGLIDIPCYVPSVALCQSLP